MTEHDEAKSKEARRAALMALINSAPASLHPAPADLPVLVDLIGHTIDDTVAHVMDHFKRAELVFTDRNSIVVMASLTLHVLELQLANISGDLLKRAEDGLRAVGGEQAVQKARREAHEAVFGKGH